MIFWALAQRQKDREKMMARAMESVRAEVQAAVREEVQAEVREEVLAEVREAERERIVQELAKRGIEVPPEIINGRSEQK